MTVDISQIIVVPSRQLNTRTFKFEIKLTARPPRTARSPEGTASSPVRTVHGVTQPHEADDPERELSSSSSENANSESRDRPNPPVPPRRTGPGLSAEEAPPPLREVAGGVAAGAGRRRPAGRQDAARQPPPPAPPVAPTCPQGTGRAGPPLVIVARPWGRDPGAHPLGAPRAPSRQLRDEAEGRREGGGRGGGR